MWKNKYQALQSDLALVENRLGGVYLADDMVDHDNVTPSEKEGYYWNNEEYWKAMYRSACSAAGYRAEEIGLNINKELGYVIY